VRELKREEIATFPAGLREPPLRAAGSAPSAAAGVSLHTGVALVAGSRLNRSALWERMGGLSQRNVRDDDLLVSFPNSVLLKQVNKRIFSCFCRPGIIERTNYYAVYELGDIEAGQVGLIP
jgi:hypothetical protein